MNCPKCGSVKYHEVKDEVDIGVGVQEHFIGYDCEDCGYQETAPELPELPYEGEPF